MPKFLEAKLKAEYGANSAVPYKVMNTLGVMRGNKITPKGAAMDKKHAVNMAPGLKQPSAPVAQPWQRPVKPVGWQKPVTRRP